MLVEKPQTLPAGVDAALTRMSMMVMALELLSVPGAAGAIMTGGLGWLAHCTKTETEYRLRMQVEKSTRGSVPLPWVHSPRVIRLQS